MTGRDVIAKTDLSKLIIDEYYINGFNIVKAVQVYFPDYKYKVAQNYYYALVKTPENRAYIVDKITTLRASVQIKAIHLLRELINLSFSDITDYMDLSITELKALPPDLRRCIQSFEAKKTIYLPRGASKGEEVTETNVKIKLFDKIATKKMIAQHIGFFLEDNKQKAVNIDLSKATNVQLNMLLTMVKEDI